MFMSGYFYAGNGRATWLVSNDPMPNPDSYDGRLLAFNGGQTLGGAYQHPGAAVDAGPVSLRFSDDRHGTLTWDGGTVAIERYAFQHGSTPSLQPKTGWWWNPDESGRGFSVELQGDHMFIGAYMYDADGNPIWYVADALMESPTVFRGPLLQFANGQTLTGAYRAPTPPASAGSLTIQFSGDNSATVTLSDQKATHYSKGAQSFSIVPQFLNVIAPALIPAERWIGNFEYTRTFKNDMGYNEVIVDVPMMTWFNVQGVSGDLANLRYPISYRIESGFAVVNLKQTVSSPGVVCEIDASYSADQLIGSLTVNANGSYVGDVSSADVLVPVTQKCMISGQALQHTINLPDHISFHFSGSLDGSGAMKGRAPDPGIQFVTLTGTWQFTPRF
jgi:hypothetical protein